MTTDLQKLCETLSAYCFTVSTEADLQANLAHVLEWEEVPFLREHAFGPDRPDFFLPDISIALELKVKGSVFEIARQLARYVAHPEIAGVLLITTRNVHRGVPRMLGGKPIAVHVLEGGL